MALKHTKVQRDSLMDMRCVHDWLMTSYWMGLDHSKIETEGVQA